MATAGKSKKKIPATIGGKNKPAGTSAAQKKPAPVADSKATGFGKTAGKRKKKSS